MVCSFPPQNEPTGPALLRAAQGFGDLGRGGGGDEGAVAVAHEEQLEVRCGGSLRRSGEVKLKERGLGEVWGVSKCFSGGVGIWVGCF